jgi:hypothetical protein
VCAFVCEYIISYYACVCVSVRVHSVQCGCAMCTSAVCLYWHGLFLLLRGQLGQYQPNSNAILDVVRLLLPFRQPQSSYQPCYCGNTILDNHSPQYQCTNPLAGYSQKVALGLRPTSSPPDFVGNNSKLSSNRHACMTSHRYLPLLLFTSTIAIAPHPPLDCCCHQSIVPAMFVIVRTSSRPTVPPDT